MKIKNKAGSFILGWILGTLSMLFMPILVLFGYEYDISVERNKKRG